MGYTSLARASLGLYSTKEDIDALIVALLKAERFFREN
jgi:selenocysteine lyase/cysteine desulfurase